MPERGSAFQALPSKCRIIPFLPTAQTLPGSMAWIALTLVAVQAFCTVQVYEAEVDAPAAPDTDRPTMRKPARRTTRTVIDTYKETRCTGITRLRRLALYKNIPNQGAGEEIPVP